MNRDFFGAGLDFFVRRRTSRVVREENDWWDGARTSAPARVIVRLAAASVVAVTLIAGLPASVTEPRVDPHVVGVAVAAPQPLDYGEIFKQPRDDMRLARALASLPDVDAIDHLLD